MTANLISSPFQLLIAGVDRSQQLQSITFGQPDTLDKRYAPTTATIKLIVPYGYEADYTYESSPEIAAKWAQGALVQFKVADDSGDLAWYFQSGQKLLILSEPDPIDENNILTIEVGCPIAYAMQRTPDEDVSGVEVGTNTARNTIVERCLAKDGLTYSIPSLPHPFNTIVPKVGGSFAEQAGKLVGAVNYVMYCNSSGTVVAAAIDLSASPIATLYIGKDEAEFKPIGGVNFPTVNQLTISGTTEVPDLPSFPLTSIVAPEFLYSNKYWILDFRETLVIDSFDRNVQLRESNWLEYTNFGTPSESITQLIRPEKITEELSFWDERDRLIRTVKNTFDGYYPPYTGGSYIVRQSGRVTTEYSYSEDELLYSTQVTTFSSFYSGDVLSKYKEFTINAESRVTTTYTKLGGNFWQQLEVTETQRLTEEAALSRPTLIPFSFTLGESEIEVGGDTYVATTYQSIGEVNWQATKTTPTTADDDSTRPPETTRKGDKKTKNVEVGATVYAQPLAGIPSKDRQAPIRVDYLVSNEQAREYGELDIRLRMGRKLGRTFVGQLTDDLMSGLRPKARIDVVFRGLIHRCVVDAITFSQTENDRHVAFICDLISTSPVSSPSTVATFSKIVNNAVVTAQAQPATTSIESVQTTDVLIAQAQPAIASLEGSVEISGELVANPQPAFLT